jgi:hypothetical protein
MNGPGQRKVSPQSKKRLQRSRLIFEMLEDRTLLAVIVPFTS